MTGAGTTGVGTTGAGPAAEAPVHLLVMGVSGSGKSTVGAALSEALSCRFLDADDLHPVRNKRLMAAGIALDDADRAPWLDAVADRLAAASGSGLVVACSALRRRYRDRLRAADPAVRLVYLDADRPLLEDRLAGRRHEFMPATLLTSQLGDLEPPGADEEACWVSAGQPLTAIVAAVLAWLAVGQRNGAAHEAV